jgi:hypothetical protein
MRLVREGTEVVDAPRSGSTQDGFAELKRLLFVTGHREGHGEGWIHALSPQRELSMDQSRAV